MRPGKVELFSLTWVAFNWKLGYVQYSQGKGGRIKRVFPPLQYLEEARLRYIDDAKASIPWVCHRSGKQVIDYRSAWLKSVKDAGLKNIRPYDIRHVAASEMLAAGADLAAVAAQLGHSNVATTGSFYAHVTVGSQQKTAALMPMLDDTK